MDASLAFLANSSKNRVVTDFADCHILEHTTAPGRRFLAYPEPQRRCQRTNIAIVQSGLRRSAAPARWRSSSALVSLGLRTPERANEAEENRSSKSSRRRPRIQAATGMPKPF